MRILCTNDDGIYAPGLKTLEAIAGELSNDVWVVAPKEEQSGAARALTLAHPLRVRKYEEKRFAVSGTPSDAVVMAITKLMEDERPDLVLSGVNNGQNLADDITVSGTIAAAYQGMALGVPSIALSLARIERENPHWKTPEVHAPNIVRKLLDAGWPADVVMNVNFPDAPPDAVSAVEATRQGKRDAFQLYAEERRDLRGGRYYWNGYSGELSDPPKGTDLRAIYDKKISITPVHLEVTHADALRGLESLFNGS